MTTHTTAQRGRDALMFGLVMACAAFSCTESADPVFVEATGGLDQAAASGGAGTGSNHTGGAASGGTDTGSSLGGLGGAAVGDGCPVAHISDFPPDLTDVGGDVTIQPVADGDHWSCPDGTIPSERFQCSDTTICACEYPCSPGCEPSENCVATSEGNVCSCHPAMEGEAGDCQWTGLFDGDVFDDCDAWRFSIFDNGFPSLAEVVDGALHLAVEQRCQTAFAQIVAKVPPADVFPHGAALVFDYSAAGTPAEAQPHPTLVKFASTRSALLPRAEPQEHRLCVQLDAYPRLVELAFAIENFGLCDQASPADLRVSNLRLEADEDCL